LSFTGPIFGLKLLLPLILSLLLLLASHVLPELPLTGLIGFLGPAGILFGMLSSPSPLIFIRISIAS